MPFGISLRRLFRRSQLDKDQRMMAEEFKRFRQTSDSMDAMNQVLDEIDAKGLEGDEAQEYMQRRLKDFE